MVFTKASAFIGLQNYATTVPVNYRSHQVHTHARPSEVKYKRSYTGTSVIFFFSTDTSARVDCVWVIRPHRNFDLNFFMERSIADFVASMVVYTPGATTTLGFTSEGTLKCTVDIDVMCRCLSDVGVGFIQRHSLCKLQICCDTFRVCFSLCQLVTTLHSHVCVEIAKNRWMLHNNETPRDTMLKYSKGRP